MPIYVGSGLTVELTFEDVEEDGTLIGPLQDELAAETVSAKVWKPDGSVLTPAPEVNVTDASAGECYIEFGEDVLDQAGIWRAQGFAGIYKSEPVAWTVKRNP